MLAAWQASRSSLTRRRWPSLCAVCRGWGEGRVCGLCLDRFAAARPRCAVCALPLPPGTALCGACTTTQPAFDSALACVDYAFPWDRLITHFKFHGALDLAPVFVRALIDALERQDTPLRPDVVIPVPLSRTRLRERGYNQAWELARRLARHMGGKADATLLQRVRHTAHQIALPPGERAGNVSGAFAVEPRQAATLHGRSIAVVDDVMTTASTANEVARTLKRAGAAHVAIWVVARTPLPDDPT